jgi:lipopolysaccharide biosynthesis glycosyltransferase
MKQDSADAPNCCVVYTTDQRYFFPTLVSAIQARQNSSSERADVLIVCVGLDPKSEELLRPICAAENILLYSFDSSCIEHQSAMMARLFLHQLLPERYTECLYIDSDVHILASLDPLLAVELPEGHFLAANDPLTFLLPDSTRQSRDLWRHLHAMGIPQNRALHYFNSGVLRFSRKTWGEICERALAHIRDNRNHLRFADQDVLNIVAFEERLPMSLEWNYPVFLNHSRVEAAIRPRLTHFMSSPKPWHGSFPPWNADSFQPYVDILGRYPSLSPFRQSMPLRSRAFYHLHQRNKQIAETLTWGWGQRRARILAYETECFRLKAPDHRRIPREAVAEIAATT